MHDEGAVADHYEVALAGAALTAAAAVTFAHERRSRRAQGDALRFRPLVQPSPRVAAAVLSTFDAREFQIACEVGLFA